MSALRSPSNFEFFMLVLVVGLGVWWIYSGSDVARCLIFAAMAMLFVIRIFIREKEKKEKR